MKLADKRGSALRHAETLIGSVDLNAIAELKSKLSRAEAALADARKESVAQTRSSKKRDAVIAKKLKHLTEELSAAKKRSKDAQEAAKAAKKVSEANATKASRSISDGYYTSKRLKRQRIHTLLRRSSA